MFTLIARILLRNRILFLVLLFGATAVMFYKAQDVRLSYRFSRLLPKQDSTQIEYDRFREIFDQVGNTVILAVDSFDVFEPANYDIWYALERDLDTIEGVSGVVSPISAYNLRRNDSLKKLEYHRIIRGPDPNLDSAQAVYQSLPFYRERLYSADHTIPLMMVQVSKDYLYEKDIVRIIASIQELVRINEQRHNLEFKVTGLPHIRMANTSKVSNEIGLFIGLSIGITTLILFLFLRSARATAVSIFVVLMGVVWCFGLIGTFDYAISMLSSLVPALIIVIGVPNCIFLINKYHNEYKGHQNKVLAIQRVIRKVGVATLMTNATTAMGFAALILTDSVVLKEFGVVASLNIMMIFFISLIIIPIFYSFAKAPKQRHYGHFEKNWLQGFIRFLVETVKHRRNLVYVIMGVSLAAAFYGMSQIYVTGNLSEEFKKSDPIYKDLKFLERNFNGSVPLEILIDTKRKNGIQSASTLKRINQLQDSLQKMEELSRPLSIVDGLKFAKQGFYRGDSSFYEMPTSQERNFILSYLPNDKNARQGLIGSLTDSTGRYARITMQVQDLGTEESHELKADIATAVDQIFPGERYDVMVTGAWVVFLKGTSYLIKNLILSLTLAIGVIAIVMAIIFRSFNMVVVSLLPNLFPLIMTAGLMGYFGVPLKPSTILVFSVAFGISVDDTIHFLAKYRQELKIYNFNIRRAVFLAIRETGVSMFYTSVVLFFGFSTFVASSFGGIVALGLLVSITLVIAMLSNLILLPTLLLSFERIALGRKADRD